MQEHYLPEDLTFGVGTSAHWAKAPSQSALVFVHGFFGHAVTTWTSFPELLLADSRLRDVDIIFYGYDGRRRQAGNSALEFLQFLTKLAEEPSKVSASGLGRSSTAQPYRRLVIAAHSLGAVIVRRALLDAARANPSWLERVRLVLFAPAHNGAYAAVLASAFISDQDWFLGKLAGAVTQYNIPLLEDLKPDSVVIRRLQDETRQALAKAQAVDPNASPAHLVPRAVVWANDDRVVINQPFESDPLALLWDGDHAHVCKPNLGFVDPVHLVINELS